MKKAVYAGTFRPFHNGHLAIIKRAARTFDKLIIGVGTNPDKPEVVCRSLRPIEESVKSLKNVEVKDFNSLLVDFAHDNGANFLIRGLRAVSDFDYEFQMSIMNKKLDRRIDTVFFMAPLKYMFLSSTIIRGVLKSGGDVKDLVPEPIYNYLLENSL